MDARDIETPGALIDIDRMQRNISRFQEKCDALGLAFRPHVTAHRVADLARLQIDAGAVGVACQTVDEARRFALAGFNDILIPANVVGEAKTHQLAELALFNRVTTTADHAMVIAGLADAARAHDMVIRVMLEVATGLERAGAAPGDLAPLAERIDKDENLHFAGLLLHPTTPDIKERLDESLSRLHKAGVGVDVVSGGGTGAIEFASELPELTEFRAGSYIFNDYTQVARHRADMDDCALLVAATVVSRPTTDRVILDCGSRTLSTRTVEGGYGYLMEYPCAYIYQLSEEHAHVDMSKCPDKPVIGERVHLIPVLARAVMARRTAIYGVRDGRVETEWIVE